MGREDTLPPSTTAIFIREGIGRPTVWEGLQAQVLLGEPEFVEKLKGYVRGYEEIGEIPQRQRYLSRPKLKSLFEGKLSKAARGPLAASAHAPAVP